MDSIRLPSGWEKSFILIWSVSISGYLHKSQVMSIKCKLNVMTADPNSASACKENKLFFKILSSFDKDARH